MRTTPRVWISLQAYERLHGNVAAVVWARPSYALNEI
jgi:hypothetical protein